MRLAKIGYNEQKTDYNKTSVPTALNCHNPSFGHLVLTDTPKGEAFLYLCRHAKPIADLNGGLIKLFTSKVGNARASKIRDFLMDLTAFEGSILKSITGLFKRKPPTKSPNNKFPLVA